ncbi:MAG: hypothetical protein JAY60_18470 [Candidatus Thiodiazotropha weberae]|nr:hypothetical protein [Candidatus Thiodiazotropha weberae]
MLSDREISNILEAEISSALGAEWGELKTDREEALNYFQGLPVGELSAPSIPNRSNVVSTDVEEVIEWILPALLKTFTQTDEAVRFEPTGVEDEALANQESDYTNYVFYKDNPGFLILYTWFKDALLLKNGYVKPYFDEDQEVKTENYTNLTDVEFSLLVNDPEVEVIGHNEIFSQEGLQSVIYHDLEIKRTRKHGQVKIDNCPPEHILVNSDHRSVLLHDARFVAHVEIKTASALREMGIPQKVIDGLPTFDIDLDDINRNTVTEEDDEDDSDDPSQRKYEVHDCYINIDQDQDGIAERRRILYVRGNHILENEAFDNVPFPSLTPIINPHRHVGRSIFDRIKEIAKQKTFVWRSLMDNLYFQTNARVAINENKVNIADMLDSRPGGVARVDGAPSENIMPIVTPQASSSAYQMIEFLDNLRDGRTGIGPEMMGQNINVSNDTAHGMERLMTAKEELIGLIARVFAETGVKELFLQIHALLIKHQNKQKIIKLRGSYVPVNPSEWRERTSMTVNVGLGTGDQMKKTVAMNQITQEQLTIIQSGGLVANQQNAYKALVDKYKLAGIDARSYFTDPSTVQPPPPKPDPQVMQIQAYREIEMAKVKNKADELKIEKAKVLAEMQFSQGKQMTDEQKADLEKVKTMFEIEMEEKKHDLDKKKVGIDAFEAGMKHG